MKKYNSLLVLVSLVGFFVLFIYFNSEKTGVQDFFKSDEEIFLNDFRSIKMEREKYLGEIADTSNHMYPYMNFGNVCLPMLDQWKNRIEKGDYVSKKKDSSTLFVEGKERKYYLHLDMKSVGSAPSPCKCSELGKKF